MRKGDADARAKLLTRTFFLAHSTASDDAMCFTAALDALYGVCGWGTLTMLPDMEPMRTMEPPSSVLSMCLAASRAQKL